LGNDTVHAQPGSFVYMPPMLPTESPPAPALRMLLVADEGPIAGALKGAAPALVFNRDRTLPTVKE